MGGIFAAFLAALIYSFAAQSKVVSAGNEFEGLLISPASASMELSKGEIYTGAMAVKNSTSSSMNVTVSVGSYNFDSGDYSNPSYDDIGQYNEIAKWINLDKHNFALQPNEVATVQYRIAVPENAPDGAQYATIFASVGNSRIGMVISALIRGGNIIERTDVLNKTSMFQAAKRPHASFIATNDGNVGSSIGYAISVSDTFTGEVVYKSDYQQLGVYPGTDRYCNVDIDKELNWGVYDVEISVHVAGEDKTMRRMIILAPSILDIGLFL